MVLEWKTTTGRRRPSCSCQNLNLENGIASNLRSNLKTLTIWRYADSTLSYATLSSDGIWPSSGTIIPERTFTLDSSARPVKRGFFPTETQPKIFFGNGRWSVIHQHLPYSSQPPSAM